MLLIVSRYDQELLHTLYMLVPIPDFQVFNIALYIN